MLPVRYGTDVSEPQGVNHASELDPVDPEGLPAERLKTFADAVVAIAMTLLVLPVMEQTVEQSRHAEGAWSLMRSLHNTIVALVMSFLMIAIVWMIHHRMFSRVERVDGTVTWLMLVSMATIVWLPVPTVMVYSVTESDWTLKLLYTGTFVVNYGVMAAIAWHLHRNPELSTDPPALLAFQAWNATAQVGLYLLVAVVVVLIPGSTGFVGFFLLVLLGPTATWLRPRMGLATA